MSEPTPSARKNIGVLISGRGSNLVSLYESTLEEDYPAKIVLVVSNRPDAPGLAWARSKGIAALELDHTRFRSREEFDDQIDRIMTATKVDIIACAGFMRLMTQSLVERWHNRMINIHPALLPLFRGLDTHARAIEAGMKVAGCTVHAVRHEMDEGPILGQAAVPILSDDTPESLGVRVLRAEHKLYPHVLRLFASDQIKIDGDRVSHTHPAVAETVEQTVLSPSPDTV